MSADTVYIYFAKLRWF